MSNKEEYRKKLHDLIPGGAHTYSRGDDQYPSNAPSILARGKGAYVWDSDGNKFLDYGMALRAVTIGYDHDPISEAAIAEIKKGNNLSRASVTECEAAEKICELIPSAEMVKFAKNGSTVTSAAVKLSRAYTGKKYVAICADHPFFTYDDWFIGTTPVSKGIPAEHTSLSLKFNYNDIASLQAIFDRYPDEIAAVIMEPATVVEPRDNFLLKVKDLCAKYASVFILDEMITGFRFDIQGAQKYYGVTPDLSTFGKGMANGFSVAALVGKKEILNQGGILEEGKERVFLISTTYGAEMCGLGAFCKTVDEYKRLNVTDHLWQYGNRLMSGINAIAKELGVQDYFEVAGIACSPYYVAKNKNKEIDLGFKTLFSQEMINNNVLMPFIALAFEHGEEELKITLEAARKALIIYAKALDEGLDRYLKGKPVKLVFRKYN
ncbi:MAG: glutamate-1-semialdehyde 2,1-aminomutase [Bacteroidetes bacterium]|nr:glutamate-1-semialdehyde 2,1-aminomutase [Bacteroidota bacterium]